MHLNIVLRKHVLYICTHAILAPKNYKTKMHKIINNSNNNIIFFGPIHYYNNICYFKHVAKGNNYNHVNTLTSALHNIILLFLVWLYIISDVYVFVILKLNTHSCTLFAGGAAFLPIIKKSLPPPRLIANQFPSINLSLFNHHRSHRVRVSRRLLLSEQIDIKTFL